MNKTTFVTRKSTIMGKYIANNADVRVKEVVISPELDVILGHIDFLNSIALPSNRDNITVVTPDGDRFKATEAVEWLPASFGSLVMPMNVSVTGSVGVYEVNWKDGEVPSESTILSAPYNKDRVIDAAKKLSKWAGKGYSAYTGYKPGASFAEVNEISVETEQISEDEEVRQITSSQEIFKVKTSETEDAKELQFLNTYSVIEKGKVPVPLKKGILLREKVEYTVPLDRAVKDLLDTAVTIK